MLDFEMKIKKLEDKIDELIKFSKEEDMDFSDEIELLKIKIDKMRREAYLEMDSWNKVKLARHKERPTALDYINNIFDDFMEFHGDRLYRDDAAIVGGIATFEGVPVTIIGQQKGKNTKDNIKRNFGMPHPEGYRKALRLMKQAEKFKRPIITFIDTPGAYCGLGAEERGQGEAIAKNLIEMAALKVPVISIVIGEGGSGGALALGIGNKVHMMENAIYSVLSPEGFASILWKDSSRAQEASEVMKITADDLSEFEIIDSVIKEPVGGAHFDLKQASKNIKEVIKEDLKELSKKSEKNLKEDRYKKFRKMGKHVEK